MRKVLCILLSLSLAVAAEAWAAPRNAPDSKAKKAKKCVFPKSKKRAPNWVCGNAGDDPLQAAVGSHAKSAAGIAHTTEMAVADARAHLAQNLRNAPGGNSAGTTDTALENTKILKRAYAPDGTLYVLVGFDQAGSK